MDPSGSRRCSGLTLQSFSYEWAGMAGSGETGNPHLHRLRDFLARYQAFGSESERFRLEDFRSGFGPLAAGLAGFRRLAAELDRRQAPRFSIFRVLGIEHREVTTHSRFLAHLLDPSGTHGQGDLFLRHFLLGPPIEIPVSEAGQVRWYVRPEKVTSLGTIDIVITCPCLRICVLIENKIGAGDQPGQLARYYRWLEASRFERSRSRLIYLTPDGKDPPGPGTFTLNDRVDLEAKDYVRCMSYRVHVRDWLTRCIPDVEAAAVARVL